MSEPSPREKTPTGPRQMVFRPTILGRYCLIDQIAKGGMSDIYLAKSMGAEGFEKPLVIKKLLPQYSSKSRYVKRFINEAHTLAQLNHSNIVQVLDMGVIGSEYYIALEYIEGRNVAHLISRAAKIGKLPSLALALHVIIELTKGLGYAHRKRGLNGENLLLVHQDVNSFNVMVSYEGEVKIIDFGIARIFLDKANREGLPVAGKLLYFSPEQLQRKPIDRRVDIYGVGVLLYELLTGERLIRHQETVGATVRAILDLDTAEKIESNQRVPAELKPILIKAMAKNPEDRYSWMEDLADATRSVVKQMGLDLNPAAHLQYLRELFPREILLDRKRMRKLMADHRPGDVGKKVAVGTSAASEETNALEELLLLCAELPKTNGLDAKKAECSSKTLCYGAGTTIFHQGDPGTEVFLIQRGKVRTYVKAGLLKPSLSVLGTGDFFGETALLGETQRNVTAEAAEDCELMALDRETFLSLASNDLAKVIIVNLVKKLRDCTFLLESCALDDTLSRLIYGLLFFQRRESSESGNEIDLAELKAFFRLEDSPDLAKYIEKLESLDIVSANEKTIQIKNFDKLNEILNILSGRGKFNPRF
jgi:serine/threonine protein kinase/CRP-like cAMP-binding protein